MKPTHIVEEAIERLESSPNKQPAGSWNLVAEERDWLTRRINYIFSDSQSPIRVMIFGVAGLQHFLDTLGIVNAALDGRECKLLLIVVDHCIQPLLQIQEFCRAQSIDVSIQFDTCGSLHQDLPTGVTVDLVHGEIQGYEATPAPLADLLLIHYLFRFVGPHESEGCVAAMNAVVRRGVGHILVAQDPVSYMPEGVRKFFEARSFKVVDETTSWGPYKLTADEREALKCGQSVEVKMDCILLDLLLE